MSPRNDECAPPAHRPTPPTRVATAVAGAHTAVDADVPGAVNAVLADLLAEHLRAGGALHPVFGREVAARVAHFTVSGGRRIRSSFLWWALRVEGAPGERRTGLALRTAAALELLQTGALVHDDVMDGSPMRRGRPAVHTSFTAQYGAGRTARAAEPFGRAAAVLAGDLALVWAEDTVHATEYPAAEGARVRSLWRALRTEMVAGQYLDLQGQITASRSALHAVRTARLKSALYSVARPMELGAALAGADAGTTRRLAAAGRTAGLAFQLRDDLLGVFGTPERTGKPVGEDVRSGKPTLLVALAHARALASGDGAALDVLERCLGDPGLSCEGLDRVRSVLEETGARRLVEERVAVLVARAVRQLDGLDADTTARARLCELVHRAGGAAPAPDPVPAVSPPQDVRFQAVAVDAVAVDERGRPS
ncbi:polyprenyl synthetase family protein [Streptomyces sp. NPDC049954]|uniref:polyprenyl synthetase family protein n=1 Tax=Streptomyces sp. NPDC049954 TaxID=3155779 RepID=UPI00341F4D0E